VTATRVSDDDIVLIGRLRAGDEDAFMDLVERLGPSMLRVARMYVSTQAVAEEVVQDAWVGVLNGIGRFEGRSSLRTWVFRILVNIAKTRGQREGRSLPFAAFEDADDEWAVPAEAFVSGGQGAGRWSTLPDDWRGAPEDRLMAAETRAVVMRAIDGLPPTQAVVIRMRDVLGMSSEDVRNTLDISETNQRVLLHRARSRVRRALEEYMATQRDGGEDE
jgi:RNA polymerase sigma-70 factor (ECF subfamily)